MRSSSLVAVAQLAASVFALPTYTSTIVSSSCSLGPTTFKYSNDTAPVTQSQSSSSEEIIYETEVVTNENVFTTDKVVCSGGSCYTTTEVESWTTTTATIDGILTTYVTHVPVTSGSASASASASSSAFASLTLKHSISNAPVSSAVTKTNVDTTIITITSCSDNKCETKPITTGVTVVTSTVKGKETIYTTYCPITSLEQSSIEPTKTLHSTTVLTVTSCSDQVCHSSGVTTGVTEVTTTIKGVKSVYTTYCPIEESTQPPAQSSVLKTSSPVAPETYTSSTSEKTSSTSIVSSSSSKVQETTGEASRTVNVITNNIVTQYSTASSAASTATSSNPRISTYEGVAAQAAPAIIGALPILLAFL